MFQSQSSQEPSEDYIRRILFGKMHSTQYRLCLCNSNLQESQEQKQLSLVQLAVVGTESVTEDQKWE